MNNIVCEKGINDMPRGWTKENKWNKLVYSKWYNMLKRVYSENFHKNNKTYLLSSIKLDWHWLSKFVEDFKKIDGYDEEKFLNNELELDKDIKSNGENKEYSLENCMLVSKQENIKQSNKTRNYNDISDKNHYLYGSHHSEKTKQKISVNRKGKCFGKENGMFGKNHSIITKEKISKTRKEKELSKGTNNPNYNKGNKIKQYDLEGNFIKIWNNANQAGKELNICISSIRKCCKGIQKQAGGYVWKYYKED